MIIGFLAATGVAAGAAACWAYLFGYDRGKRHAKRYPESAHHIEITCDTSEAEAKIGRLAAKIERVETAMRALTNGPV